MSTLIKTLLAALATMLVAGAAYAATTPSDGSTSTTPTPAATDVKGPCDEAEHANDPRCAGAQVREDRPNADRHGDRNRADDDQLARHENEAEDVGDDDPGEAEHHGNRGPGSQNSGPGNAEDPGDDRAMEDHSGPGSDDSGHSGSDESGSGHSGSDHSGSDDSGSGRSGRD